MKGFLTPVFILGTVATIGLVAYSLPLYKQTVACSDRSIESFDEVAFRSRAQNWDQQFICENQRKTVIDFEECVTSIEKEPVNLQKIVQPYVENIVGLLYPSYRSIEVLKKNHDSVCLRYPRTLFSTE